MFRPPSWAWLCVLYLPQLAFGGELKAGAWRAWFDSPGGELPFGIELERRGDGWGAWLVNEPERIEVPRVEVAGAQLTFDIEHYDATLTAAISEDGTRLDGEWKKRGRNDQWSTLPFHAVAGPRPRFQPWTPDDVTTAHGDIVGRWRAEFSQSDEPAIGVFRRLSDGTVSGTFLTTTGDYRFLTGTFEHNRLRLSCFDGSHAFLFDAKLQGDGSLSGDFWSRNAWHETWTAHRAPDAKLPDGFKQSRSTAPAEFDKIVGHDLEGVTRTLADPRFAGKARIIEVFGTWCPNCHDAGSLLSEMHHRYARRGLSIVGLAFEYSGEFDRAARQVRRYVKRLDIPYPVLVAGTADRETVAQVLPFLDGLRAYPTTIFLHGDGRVRAVHSGFAGPAAREDYLELRAEFESVIEELLSESAPTVR